MDTDSSVLGQAAGPETPSGPSVQEIDKVSTGLEGLDYAFLRWLPVESESQKAHQSFYLPFFEGCETVIDLGCGDGDFVELLAEHGIHAVGVDLDRKCCQAAWQRGIDVVHQDALDYLAQMDAESVDGVFSAHLVEHLPYETVIELLRRVYRVLKPGGIIVLATPNVRGLFSHLEMFYIHFGHVTFYHPRLLCFFLEFTGFTEVENGENPTERRPLFGDVPGRQAGGSVITRMRYDPMLPRPTNPLRWPIWLGKMLLVKLIVQPYLDHFMTEINRGFGEADQALDWIMKSLTRLDRPFECYAVGRKPER